VATPHTVRPGGSRCGELGALPEGGWI